MQDVLWKICYVYAFTDISFDYIKIDRCLINLSHIQLQVCLILMANIPKHQSVPKEGNKILDKPWLAIGIHLVILWLCQYEHYFFFSLFLLEFEQHHKHSTYVGNSVHWVISRLLIEFRVLYTDYMPPS